MIKKIFCLLVAFACFSSSLLAETYIREYTYKASEADSKLSSRTIALDQVKVLLLQEIGTHIRQTINITKNSSGSTYTSEDIEAITAGITKVDILEEKWDGVTYYLKAKIDADAQQVLKALEEHKKVNLKESQKQIEELKANENALKTSRETIARLRSEINNIKTGSQNESIVAEYMSEVDQLSIKEMVSSGIVDYYFSAFDTAIISFRKAAELGDTVSQYYLGVMYEKGYGIKRDYYESAYWYRKAAKKGYIDAQINLGMLYVFGEGVKQDYAEAARLFLKAAEQGDVQAQTNIAVLYGTGQGVNINHEQAYYWYKKAAEQGNAGAQYNLGMMYENGSAVSQDYNKALYWYNKAAEQGYNLEKRKIENVKRHAAGN